MQIKLNENGWPQIKVPIIYFIHGGGFSGGNNMGDYATLVTTEGVMVISVAYRLGIYGFLYNTDGEDGEGSDTLFWFQNYELKRINGYNNFNFATFRKLPRWKK